MLYNVCLLTIKHVSTCTIFIHKLPIHTYSKVVTLLSIKRLQSESSYAVMQTALILYVLTYIIYTVMYICFRSE